MCVRGQQRVVGTEKKSGDKRRGYGKQAGADCHPGRNDIFRPGLKHSHKVKLGRHESPSAFGFNSAAVRVTSQSLLRVGCLLLDNSREISVGQQH